MKKIMLSFMMLFPLSAFAGVGGDLDSFFKNLNMSTNMTHASAYHGQAAGYYNGGSLYAVTPVRNFQLMEVNLPSYHAGCGGIDLFKGGFSFISSEKLSEAMQTIISNGGAYGLLLGMEEISPQLANAMKYIEDMANKINQMNINSCETAESIVGGLWPKTQAAQRQVCEDVGVNRGIFSDWAQARQGCNSDKFEDSMNKGANDPQYKKYMLAKGNVAWNSLKDNHLVSDDHELAELLMSLSGSIIVDINQSESSIRYLPSLASDNHLIKALFDGGEAQIWSCNDYDQCLTLHQKTITINQDQGLKNKVINLIRSISEKILNDDALTDQELGLLQATRIPLYKILTVQVAYQKNKDILDVESYAQVIASDILFQYLQDNLDTVRIASHSLQYPQEIMQQFHQGIDQAVTNVREKQKSAQVQMSYALQLIEQTQVIEQMLAGQLSVSVGNSLNFANSLH